MELPWESEENHNRLVKEQQKYNLLTPKKRLFACTNYQALYLNQTKSWGPPEVSLSADERWLVWRPCCRRSPFCFALSLQLCFCSYLPLHSETWPRRQGNTHSSRWPYHSTLPATRQPSQLKLEKGKFPLFRRERLCSWLRVAVSNTMLTADYSEAVGPAEE